MTGAVGQRRQTVGEERPEAVQLGGRHAPRLVGMHPSARAVMSDLERSVGESREAVPARACDVRGPDGKTRR